MPSRYVHDFRATPLRLRKPPVRIDFKTKNRNVLDTVTTFIPDGFYFNSEPDLFDFFQVFSLFIHRHIASDVVKTYDLQSRVAKAA